MCYNKEFEVNQNCASKARHILEEVDCPTEKRDDIKGRKYISANMK